jgi:hypothetical protein
VISANDVLKQGSASELKGLNKLPTSSALHPARGALVQQPDPKTDVHLHLFLLQLPRHTILHDDVRRILHEATRK